MCNIQLHECQGEKTDNEHAVHIGVEMTVVAVLLCCAFKPVSLHLSLLSKGVLALFPILLESPGMH